MERILMTRQKLKVTKEDVLKDMKDFYEQHGKLTKRAFYATTSYSEYFVQDNFGQFNELKSKVTGTVNTYRVSKEDLVADVLRVYNDHGRISKDFYIRVGKYSRKPIDRIFGTFNKMLEELGLPLNVYRDANRTIELFEEVLGEKAIKEKTFDWLKNDKTNYNMYLDAYFPTYNLALEHHGIQHYEFVPFMEKYEGAFEERQYRDKRKKDLCLAEGMKFIEYAYNEPITREHVVKKLIGIV